MTASSGKALLSSLPVTSTGLPSDIIRITRPRGLTSRRKAQIHADVGRAEDTFKSRLIEVRPTDDTIAFETRCESIFVFGGTEFAADQQTVRTVEGCTGIKHRADTLGGAQVAEARDQNFVRG